MIENETTTTQNTNEMEEQIKSLQAEAESLRAQLAEKFIECENLKSELAKATDALAKSEKTCDMRTEWWHEADDENKRIKGCMSAIATLINAINND